MRILLTGANGQLAQDLRRCLIQEDVVGVTHQQLDICDESAVQNLVSHIRPQCIVNTAAFHRVDDCEDKAEMAFAVNAAGVGHLARAAQQVGAVLVHFSTNYVFDGTKGFPYMETDQPKPLSIYGISKLAGEWVVQQYCEKHFLVRSSGLYGLAGGSSKGGNFVEKMLRLAREERRIRVVAHQVLTPTSTRDLAEKLVPLIRTDRYGLYHMTNSGECSWYDFAQEIFRHAGLSPNLAPTTSESFGAKARRPAYSVLQNDAWHRAGFPEFRPWQEALAEFMWERQKQNG